MRMFEDFSLCVVIFLLIYAMIELIMFESINISMEMTEQVDKHHLERFYYDRSMIKDENCPKLNNQRIELLMFVA